MEHVNAEIVLKTITDLDEALRWLMSTFWYVRAKKDPQLYNISKQLNEKQREKKILGKKGGLVGWFLIERVLAMCQIEINRLVKAGMCRIDENLSISATETGFAMAKYSISFESMKLFTTLSGSEVLQQIFAQICKSHEFSEIRLRVDEKTCLNAINLRKDERIRFPLNGRIKTLDMKVSW